MSSWQPILKVRGAGGTIFLLGNKHEAEHWEFCRSSDANKPQHEPKIVHTFSEALFLLGPSWKYLSPEYIHPEFKQQCWTHLAKQTGMFDRVNWRKACL